MSTKTLTDNAATVGKLYEAFGRGDIPYIINLVADNCQWIGSGEGFLPAGGTYKGKEAINFFIKLNETVEFTSFNPVSINNINDNEVIAFGNMAGNSKITGKPSSSDWAMHWKFNHDGKVIYYQDFHNTAAAYVANQH
jgi:ketosteroid isomerase-like protein